MRTLLNNLNLTDIKIADYNNNFSSLIWVDNLLLASKITESEEIELLKKLNINLAIDLKEAGESAFADKEEFQKSGIDYYNFAISDLDNLSFDDLTKIKEKIEEYDGNKFIYCMSGNRVAALLSLMLSEVLGHPKQRAYKFALKIGLTKEPLKEKLQKRLGLKEKKNETVTRSVINLN